MNPLSFKMSVGSGFLLIWIIIIMLQTHFPFSAACLQDERSYLLDFKAGLDLSSGRLSSWQGFNCCKWEGVGCDYHTSHVIRLDLSNHHPYEYSQQLSGEVSPSLFNLHHLQHLDLSSNFLLGVLRLSKLQRLTFLCLSNTAFEVETTLELGNMSSLRHLDISFCSLESSKFDVWVRNLRNLEFLAMDAVYLGMASEQLGEALSGLANLTQIHLHDCGLSGNIPDLSNLTHLSHLHIGNNFFPFELPFWFDNVSSLVSLDLANCYLNVSIRSNFMPRSRLNNLELRKNDDLKGNISFILGHSYSLVVLSLSECNIGGEFSPSIANFSKLKTMDLSWNNLEGSIPSSFGSLLSLKTMDLSSNNLQGSIPSSFGSLLSLETIDLSTNDLEGSIPSSFGSLSSLRSLDLRHNRLSGHIPPSLCQLPTLSYLALSYNQLSGTIPDSISKLASLEVLALHSSGLRGNFSLQLLEKLPHLQHLDLSDNQLLIKISTSWVPQFAQLQVLQLRSCNIEGELPAFLSQQFHMFALDLSGNNIVGNLPSWLWDLQLSILNLSNNQLEGSLPRQIPSKLNVVDLHGNRLYGSLPALDFVVGTLDLSDNEFNGSIPATSDTLSFLSLSGNNLTGEIPSSICDCSYKLQVLDLSKNKLTGKIPSNIGRCSQLSVLKLTQNVLQRQIPEELGNLTALRTLNLNGNKLQGIIPSFIANCTDLQVFDLGNNQFEGSIPVWIEKLTDLRILSFTSNKLNDTIPPQLCRLHNLQILDLPGNQLSGSIPPDVSKLYAMVNNSQIFDKQYYLFYGAISYFDMNYGYNFADEVTVWLKGRATRYTKIMGEYKFMDLSRNNLSGNIPPELGFLKGLISLNISKNNLSGSIPESLGAMPQLESLDLSENKLSGKIPSQLLNLTFLAVLNLSDNLLSGLIPQGKQFSTFEASAFLGNPNLHGPQLENRTLDSGLGGREIQRELNNTGGEDVMDRWWAVGVGLSYGVGFGTVIAVLCFHIKWRYRCFARMDNFIYYLFER